MTETASLQPTSLLAVQHAVNSFTENLRCETWDSVLPFEATFPMHNTSNFSGNLYFQHHDNILEYCSPTFKGMRCYFQPVKYPPPIKKKEARSNRYLEWMALQNGFHLIANGGGKNKQLMQCKYCRTYNPIKSESSTFRVTSLHNDGLNSHGCYGLLLSHRNKSGCPSDTKHICLFNLNLFFNGMRWEYS